MKKIPIGLLTVVLAFSLYGQPQPSETTLPIPPPAATEFTVVIKAPSYIYAGGALYGRVTIAASPAKFAYGRVKLPPGAILAAKNTRKDGRILFYTSKTSKSLFQITKLPVGTHNLSLEVEAQDADKTTKTITFNVDVRPVPSAQKSSALRSAAKESTAEKPAAIEKWEAAMLVGAKKFCGADYDYGSFGSDRDVSFYDGARVFFNIAKYTGDPSWEPCAMNIASQYADYIIRAKGYIAGWRVFSTGLRMAYEKTKDSKYRQALVLLGLNSNAARFGGDLEENRMRETAYAIKTYIDSELAGEPRNEKLAMSVDYLLAQFNFIFVSNQYKFHQMFIEGLAAESLISYFELTKDPRVLPSVKLMLDWHKAKAWDYRTNKMWYLCRAGQECSGSQHTGLINLVAPAFAWYAAMTGDMEMQKHYDLLFEHAHAGNVTLNGKQFSQNFRWSFEGLKWRYPVYYASKMGK